MEECGRGERGGGGGEGMKKPEEKGKERMEVGVRLCMLVGGEEGEG